MAQLRWITPEGNLGTYAENTEVSLQLEVENPVAPVATAGFDPRNSISGNGVSDEVQVTMLDAKTVWRIQSLNLPGLIKVGGFPNDENPNRISAQAVDLQWPYRGGLNRIAILQTPVSLGPIGISATGIAFFGPSLGINVATPGGMLWTINGVSAKVLGEDIFGGQPTPSGVYHYKTSQFINADAWSNLTNWRTGYRHPDGHSKILGWAADGYPIYGPYGYDNPLVLGGVVRMQSGFTAVEKTGRPLPTPVRIQAGRHTGVRIPVTSTENLFPGMHLKGPWPANTYKIVKVLTNEIQVNAEIKYEFLEDTRVLGVWPLGSFIQDFEYTAPLGTTLDQSNGRYCVTPEFPNGTYAYFMTEDKDANPTFPYIIGTRFFGSLSSDEVPGIANIEPAVSTINYSLLSGRLPPGLQVTPQGVIYGFPQVTTAGDPVAREFRFTVRAKNTANQIADRTFSVFVNQIVPPSLLPAGVRGEGIGQTRGNINLSFTNRGLGYFAANVAVSITAPDIADGEAALPGKIFLFANGAIKSIGLTKAGTGYTSIPTVTFTGANTNTASATIDNLTRFGIEDLGYFFDGDPVTLQINALETSPTGRLDWSVSQGRLPPGLSLSQTGLISGFALAPAAAGAAGTAAYDVGGYDEYVWDFEGASDSRRYQFTIRIYDGINYSYQRYSMGIYGRSYFLIDNSLITADSTLYSVDRDGYLYPSILTTSTDLPPVRQLQSYAYQFRAYYANPNAQVKWAVNASGPARFDQGAPPFPDENGNVFTIVPFDNKSFDQTNLSLPGGIFLDLNTGWLLGTLGTTTVYESTYEFSITAYVDIPISESVTSRRSSQPVKFSLRVLSAVEDIITWNTDTDLGSIDNGAISTLQISAASRSGADLTYRIKSGQYLRIPQGLKLLSNGLISGRTTFDFFSLDRSLSEITFDKDTNSYDSKFLFTVIAQDSSGNIYSEKEFSLVVKNVNQKPYENLYLKALLPAGLRQVFRSIVTDPNLSSSDIIYRSNDPYFGIHLDLTMLVQAGIRAETAAHYVDAMSEHHIDKKINFGTIRKAVARNPDSTIKYEVLYVDVLDYNTANQPGEVISINKNTGIDYGNILSLGLDIDDFNSVDDRITRLDDFGLITSNDLTGENTVFTNSFANMAADIERIGYEFQGALPEWMLSVQPGTNVPLGLTRGLVLAYANPGQGDKLLYRYQAALEQSGFSVGDIMNTFKFTADRYQWDRALSENYDADSNAFVQSETTTFDRVPSVGVVDKGAWLTETSGTGNQLTSIAYKPGQGYLAVGANSSILQSRSGQKWTIDNARVNFAFSFGTLNSVVKDTGQILQFAYTPVVAVGDEVLQTDVFTSNTRSFVTSVENSIRLSSNIANSIVAGTTLEFVSWQDGSRFTANLTRNATALHNEIYLDTLGHVEPGYALYVKGIDIANAAIVTANVGNTLFLSNITTNLIPAGTQITFDDLRGNVSILTTANSTPLGSNNITFLSLSSVTANYYPRITSLNSGTTILAKYTYANISVAPSANVAAGSDINFSHKITANAVAGDTQLNLSDTSLLPIGTQIYNVTAIADSDNTAAWSAVTPFGTSMYITVRTAGINGTIFRGMNVVGPGIPITARIAEITANATYSNLAVVFANSTVSAQSNVAISFSTPTTVLDNTTIIGKTDTSITLSNPLAGNINIGYDNTVSFGLTGVVLNKVISVADRWLAVGDRGLIIQKSVTDRSWSQQFGLLYGDLKAVGVRSYSSGVSTLYTYVAVGNEGTIIRSTDGQTWSLPIITLANRTLTAVYHNEGVWIAVGEGGQIVTSTDDGLSWTLDNTTTSLNLYDVYYSGQWIIVGQKGNVWLKSQSGNTWRRYSVGITDTLRGIAFVNNQYVVVGDRGSIAYSTDATTWRLADRFIGTQLSSVSRDAVTPVAVGLNGVILREAPNFTVTWAIRGTPFDQIHLKTLTSVKQKGYSLKTGDTLIFAQQEGFGTLNDGWNLFGETFGTEPASQLGYDTGGYDQLTVIPGYAESVNTTTSNQRAGIWQVTIADDFVILSFVRQILPNQVVTVIRETSKLFYDPLIKPGKTVPEYSLLSGNLPDSTQNTSFDGEGTRFVSDRDNYTEPGALDKYIKFPKTGVFR